jgi:tetrahydromethanopterin S-methyltransferase subunit H
MKVELLKFDREQHVFEIGSGVMVGGQPGEYPTVLIGSIFYSGHKIVKNHLKGEFDKSEAETLIQRTEELSDKVGNPHVLDVVGSNSEALIKYIDFIADVTDQPFLIDGPSPSVRIPAARHVAEVGLMDRAVYNSIDEHTGVDEVKALREIGVKSSMLLAFSMKKVWPEGRIDVLKGYEGGEGLVELAHQAGITNILVDTAVLDLASVGLAAKAVYLVKSELGLPAGCGPCNASTTWAKGREKYGETAYQACDSAVDAVIQLNGGDFVLYGPIREAERAFPVCALIDALIAYANKRYGVTPKVKNHPIYKVW